MLCWIYNPAVILRIKIEIKIALLSWIYNPAVVISIKIELKIDLDL
jgi:hypothetical protein